MQVEGASNTNTGTASDNSEPMDVSDLQGMSNAGVDKTCLENTRALSAVGAGSQENRLGHYGGSLGVKGRARANNGAM